MVNQVVSMNIRVPPDLKKCIEGWAKAEGRSVNKVTCRLLQESVDRIKARQAKKEGNNE